MKEETILDKRMKTITEELPVAGYDKVVIRINEKDPGLINWVLLQDSHLE